MVSKFKLSAEAFVTNNPGKPVEIEGFFDLHFYTPLGGVIARSLSLTKATPNQLSWTSVVLAGMAAAAYLVQTLPAALLGSLLLLASGVMDSADGQLARATGRTSELGETLDGFCDTLSFGLIYLAAVVVFVAGGGAVLPIVALWIAASLSHSVQSSLVDYERQVFVHIIMGSGRVLREDPSKLAAAQRRARARGESWWPQLLRAMRLAYCRRQRRWLTSTTTLLAAHEELLANNPDRQPWFAEHYRAATRPLLRAWAVLAPNSHTLGLLIGGLAPYIWPGSIMARWGLALVFLFDLALNVPMVGLIVAQRRTDAALGRRLAGWSGDTLGRPTRQAAR